MWTPTTRKKHNRKANRYQTDVTDEEWRVIEPHLPAAKGTGRPRAWPMREIINGIFYVMRAGCPWRLLPSDLPPWNTIYRWFATFRDESRFEKINHALAIDDRTRETGLAADPFALEHDQGVVDLLEATLVAERRKPAIDRVPRRQIARQQTPRTARPHHIEDAVDDLAHRPSTRSSCALRRRQVRFDHAPFLIGHVGLVSVGLAVMLLAGGWSPHGNSGVGVRTPWNHVDTSHSTPFKTASKIRAGAKENCGVAYRPYIM